jgi:hypothetical protein
MEQFDFFAEAPKPPPPPKTPPPQLAGWQMLPFDFRARPFTWVRVDKSKVVIWNEDPK